jgi:uncharacterized protein with beta-barrel porin domain
MRQVREIIRLKLSAGIPTREIARRRRITATFLSLPGSSFIETGAAPARDLVLASAGVEIGFGNGFSLAAWFDGEFAEHSRKYAGTGRLRYTW